ncbi:MAG: PD-(D/E)XK nuclease family protein [Patescibacteria group bacterium]
MSQFQKSNKYSSIWVSHSSIGDFLKCHRAYFLKNIYKNPKTKRKIGIVNPALSLGSAVHEVIENLANYKSEERMDVPILDNFENVWEKYRGEKGGFFDQNEENNIKERGIEMIKRVKENIKPLLQKTVKLKNSPNGMLPNFILSDQDNIILCGKIDWLIWKPEDDSLHILDFKTGKNEENEDSLQLPIYQLLLKSLQKRKVTGASYWYLDRDNEPKEKELTNIDDSYEKVIEVAKKIKEIRESGIYKCPNGERGCYACIPFEMVLRGEARYIGAGEWQDLYINKI